MYMYTLHPYTPWYHCQVEGGTKAIFFEILQKPLNLNQIQYLILDLTYIQLQYKIEIQIEIQILPPFSKSF